MAGDERDNGVPNTDSERDDPVRAVQEPERGAVTEDDVRELREDPDLSEVAEIAERYASRGAAAG
jgi:hypothetical protein